MTTLNVEQTEFLHNYTMMVLENDINEQLSLLRESDEFKEAIEEGKTDEDVLAKIEKLKEILEKENKLVEIKKNLIENFDEKYTIAYNRDYELDEAYIKSDETDIDKVLEKELNKLVEQYATDKTGYFENSQSGINLYDIKTEVRARLSVNPLGNFDDIVDSMLGQFDTTEIVETAVENWKTNHQTK